MSFKKWLCLCLVAIAGSFGGLATSPAAAQTGHALYLLPLTEADINEVKALLTTYLMPAMTDTQQAMGVVSSNPDQSCTLGKSAVSRIRELRRRLVELSGRYKREGKDISQLETMLVKLDSLLLPGQNPEDIYCEAAAEMKTMSPEERAWTNKITDNSSAYLTRLNAATDAAMKGDKPTACNQLKEAQKILLEMDDLIKIQRDKDKTAGKPVDGYDHLMIVNQTNKQKTTDMMAQVCPVS